MKKFEFVCKTDLLTGVTCWLTKKNDLFVPGSLRLDKDKAYDIFIRLCKQEPLESDEVLETIISPTE